MTSNTSQVPAVDPLKFSEAELDALLATILAPDAPLFPELSGAKRSYPGEAEAQAVLRFMALKCPPRVRNIFFRSLDTLRSFEAATQRHDYESMSRMAKRPAIRDLERFVLSRPVRLSWQKEGLLVKPGTDVGLAALGLLLLAGKRLVTRIRQCVCCQRWFFARFKNQQFCSDKKTKCQWNHYHSPMWRKKHREQNRRHQRNFRKNTFGRRSR